MRTSVSLFCIITVLFANCKSNNSKPTVETTHAANTNTATNKYIDVHDLQPGGVTFKDVMDAHQKDLATQGKYGVRFVKFWVDESKGKVYCLSEANDSSHVINTHREAHGLLPSAIMQVKEGE